MSVYQWMAVLAVMCFVSSSCLESQVTAESELNRQICAHKNITAVQYGIISCNNGNLSVLECYCATYNMSEEVLVGACIFNCGNYDRNYPLYHPLPIEVCASLNRTGTLCGKCCEGHFVSAYSLDLRCMPCDNISTNWIWYIMAAYLPLTLFYLIVLFFKVNVASGYLHPVALFGQTIAIPPLARIAFRAARRNPSLFQFTQVFGSFYGIWSLDFFRPFYSDLCLGIGILPILALDYVIAVYPLLLMIISYLLIVLYDRNYRVVTIMWKPFRLLFSLFKRNWDIRTSVIDAYATFFLLSYMKFLNVSFDLLAPTQVYHLNINSTYTWGLFYSGDIKYFGKEHLPYGILAIAVMCVFVILPTVTLALYPFAFFQKFLNLFPFQWNTLHMFMDSFQGCYKNGTEPGTRDCRWISAAYLVLRWVFLILYGFTFNSSFFPLCSVCLIIFIVLLVIFQPFKTSRRHNFEIVLFAMLAAFCMAISGHSIAVTRSRRLAPSLYIVIILLGMVPLLFIIVLIFHGVVSRWKFFFELIYRIRSWCQRHKALADSAETVDSDRVINPQEYPAIPMRRYNSLVDLLKAD